MDVSPSEAHRKMEASVTCRAEELASNVGKVRFRYIGLPRRLTESLPWNFGQRTGEHSLTQQKEVEHERVVTEGLRSLLAVTK